MSPRRQRIEKVVQHRGKELDKRDRRAQRAENPRRSRRLHAAMREREEARRASEKRLKLAEAPLSATDWIAANEWLKSRAAVAEQAALQAVKAHQGTQARARACASRAHRPEEGRSALGAHQTQKSAFSRNAPSDAWKTSSPHNDFSRIDAETNK